MRTRDVAADWLAWRSGRFWAVAILLLVSGCTYACGIPQPPSGTHRFYEGSDVWDLELETPMIGGIIGLTPAHANSAQFSPDGRTLYVQSGRGTCEHLASAAVHRPRAGVLEVDLRLAPGLRFPSACNAAGLIFGVRIALEPPVDPAQPPEVIDADDGEPVQVDPYLE
jgi:hypothetical protein